MSVLVAQADAFSWVPREIEPSSVPLVIVDPPYGGIVNEGWDRKWTALEQDQMTDLIAHALVPGGTAYVWGGIGTWRNRVFFDWLAHVERRFDLRVWDVITWRKRRFYGSSRRYGFVREECAMLVRGNEPRTFNVPYLEKERGYVGFDPKYPAKDARLRRTNVWDDVTELFSGKIHRCEKPSRLAEIMIETSSKPGEMVLDFFAGSGSTGVAASKLGRPCILVENENCEMHWKKMGEFVRWQ